MTRTREQRLPVSRDWMTKARRRFVKLNPWYIPDEAGTPSRAAAKLRAIKESRDG